ncbi:MAG: ArsI/CadI family heavy metal resistance metalloenzyme [Armatimonadota bacterium]
MKPHISLNVQDIEAGTRFYTAFFGQEPHKVRPGYANFDVASPPIKLALNQAKELLAHGTLNHLGILVESHEDVISARQRLAAAGLMTIDEDDTLCCHARQDKVWAFDPDGHAREIYAITDDMSDDELAAHANEARLGPDGAICGAPTPPLRPRGLSLNMAGGCAPQSGCCS